MEENKNFLKTEDVNSKGYGIVPKLVMQDTELDVVAKSFYAYLCSFAGAGDTAFPTLDKICIDLGISRQRLERHKKLLVEKGYIGIEQIREKGKFKHNVYTINKTVSPMLQKPMLQKPTSEKPMTENITYNNNISFKNNSINKINSINNTSSSEVDEVVKYYKQFNNLPKFIKLTDKRKKSVNARIKDHGVSDVKTSIQLANSSKFLTDNLNSSWYNFDWIFNPNNMIKILEGKYSGGANNGLQQHTRGLSSEEQDVWDKLQSL